MAYDVIVLGVGGMGSAAAAHLARRGQRVLALEQFAPGHANGSSHGETRIIRLAYYEHPSYVPLLRRAFALWRALESDARATLLTVTGALDVGAEGSRVFEGSRAACHEHALPHEVLSGSALGRRFPAWHRTASLAAVLQPDGGILAPEACIAAHVAMAAAHGATIRSGERVVAWSTTPTGVRVETARDTYEATQLVITAGAWMPQLVPLLASVAVPERQVVGWFRIAPDAQPRFNPAQCPVFVLENGQGHFYGFPASAGTGFKIGKYHHRGETVDANSVDRTVHPADERVLREAVRTHFPDADGPMDRASVCLFTNTPDEHFIVDRLPEAPAVLVVSACSGHGFKFCSVIGEIVADLVAADRTAHDISRFTLARFP
jgi:sarcosine oxidase